MTTSSSAPQRGLDAAPIVYGLLNGHPASVVCEHYIRNRTGAEEFWNRTGAGTHLP